MDYRNRKLPGVGQAEPSAVVVEADVGIAADVGGGVAAAVIDGAACSRFADAARIQLRNVIEGSIRPETDQMWNRPAKPIGGQTWELGGIQTSTE